MFNHQLLRGILAVSFVFALLAPSQAFAQGNDWYVSAARGKGKSGTHFLESTEIGKGCYHEWETHFK